MATSGKKSSGEQLVAKGATAKDDRQAVAKNRREERMKAYERNRKQWMWTKIGAAIVGVLILAGVGFLVYEAVRDNQLNQVPEGVKEFAYAGGNHDDAFNAWPESPPVGGVHNDQWMKCGYYSSPVNPGMAVHTLEHGAVWITYSPDLPQDQIDVLKGMADESYMLVSPYEGLMAPIVVQSWGRQLNIQDANSEELKQFIRVFKNNPEYTPEFGATCANGVDIPM